MISHYQYKKLSRARDFIADRCTTEIRLIEAANIACMSPYHFIRTFTKAYGETPHAFLVRCRFELAKSLLITENYSIGEICEKIGYVSIGSFSSRFSKLMGVSPALYRRRLWGLSSEPFKHSLQSIPLCYARSLFGGGLINEIKPKPQYWRKHNGF